MREVVTIQCGSQANYMGAHFWNFQEQYLLDAATDLDNDVLYQAGLSPSGIETYTPRVLIYDCARNMGSLRKINQLYETSNQFSPAPIVKPETFPEHPFQDSLASKPDNSLLSDDNVHYWSDYNMQFLSPASYLPIDSTAVDRPLIDWQEGSDAYTDRNHKSNIMDEELRPFVEQCDCLQGFNILGSSNDGWSGFGSELIIDLDTEYTKIAKCYIDNGNAHDRTSHYNRAQIVLAINDLVDIVVPIGTKRTWTGSAQAGLWLDSITLPLRSKQSLLQWSDIVSFLSPTQKIFRATIGEKNLSSLENEAQTRFAVSRNAPHDMRSKMVDGKLETVYEHPLEVSNPASFPSKYKNSGATLDFTPRGVYSWLQKSSHAVQGIVGLKDYSERKDVVESLTELAGTYLNEFDEISSVSSDGDDF